MRRLGRYILNAVTVASLALCVSIAALWVRSHWVADYVGQVWHNGAVADNEPHHLLHATGIQSDSGRICLIDGRVNLLGPGIWLVTQGFNTTDTRVGFHHKTSLPGAQILSLPKPSKWGFGFSRSRDENEITLAESRARFREPGMSWATEDKWQVYVPYWFLSAITAALPAAWIMLARPLRRRARRRLGLCWRCGYDVRATPDRCPECGAAVAGPAARSRAASPST